MLGYVAKGNQVRNELGWLMSGLQMGRRSWIMG